MVESATLSWGQRFFDAPEIVDQRLAPAFAAPTNKIESRAILSCDRWLINGSFRLKVLTQRQTEIGLIWVYRLLPLSDRFAITFGTFNFAR